MNDEKKINLSKMGPGPGPRPIIATSSNGRLGPFGNEWMVIVAVKRKRANIEPKPHMRKNMKPFVVCSAQCGVCFSFDFVSIN